MSVTQARTIREVLAQSEMAPYIQEEILPGREATSDVDILERIARELA
jgi:hypothetical protein